MNVANSGAPLFENKYLNQNIFLPKIASGCKGREDRKEFCAKKKLANNTPIYFNYLNPGKILEKYELDPSNDKFYPNDLTLRKKIRKYMLSSLTKQFQIMEKYSGKRAFGEASKTTKNNEKPEMNGKQENKYPISKDDIRKIRIFRRSNSDNNNNSGVSNTYTQNKSVINNNSKELKDLKDLKDLKELENNNNSNLVDFIDVGSLLWEESFWRKKKENRKTDLLKKNKSFVERKKNLDFCMENSLKKENKNNQTMSKNSKNLESLEIIRQKNVKKLKEKMENINKENLLKLENEVNISKYLSKKFKTNHNDTLKHVYLNSLQLNDCIFSKNHFRSLVIIRDLFTKKNAKSPRKCQIEEKEKLNSLEITLNINSKINNKALQTLEKNLKTKSLLLPTSNSGRNSKLDFKSNRIRNLKQSHSLFDVNKSSRKNNIIDLKTILL